MLCTNLIKSLCHLIYSKLYLRNSIEVMQFILHIYVVLNHKIIILVINNYLNKNVLFLTYFANTFMIIVVYSFEIHCFTQLHINSYKFLCNFSSNFSCNFSCNFSQLHLISFKCVNFFSFLNLKFYEKNLITWIFPYIYARKHRRFLKSRTKYICVNYNHKQNIKQ